MIQNIEPHVYRNEYVLEPPKEDSVILYYEGRKILVKLEEQGDFFPDIQRGCSLLSGYL